MSELGGTSERGGAAERGAADGGLPGRLRILLVLGSSAGGVGTHVKSLAAEFGGAGHDVVVAGPDAANAQFGFSDACEYRRLEVPASLSLADRNGVTRLRDIIRTDAPDVVHAHGFRAGLLASLAVPRAAASGEPTPSRRPLLITTWHNAVLGGGVRARVLGLVERFIARRADVTLGASRDLVQRASRLGARDARLAPVAAPQRVIDGAGPGDVDSSGSARTRLRAELGLDSEIPIVLSVGRVAPQKNFGLLVDAAARLRETPVRFVIAGGADAGELVTLERRSDKQRLPVEFLGPRDDVAELYRAADLFLLTSHWEARALVVQEAMAAGLPVVATAVGGLPELIGDTGVLVEPGPAAAENIATAIKSLLTDADRRRDLAARAKKRAADFPDEHEAAVQLLAVYAESLATAHPRKTRRGV